MPTYNIQQTTTIHADPTTTYQHIRNFQNWQQWSPTLITDPQAEAAQSKDGKHHSWHGDLIGHGEIHITHETPPKNIQYQLQTYKPHKTTAQTQFTLQPTNNNQHTQLTWTLHGTLPLFLFFLKNTITAALNMELQRGLKMLKACIETGTNPSKLKIIGPTQQPQTTYLGITTQTTLDQIHQTLPNDFQTLHTQIQRAKAQTNGNPFTIYHKFNPTTRAIHYTVALPTDNPPIVPPVAVQTKTRPQTPTYAIQHTGPYEHLGNAWAAALLRQRQKTFTHNKKIPPYEIYQNDPKTTPPEQLITTLHYPTQPQT